MTGKAGRGRHPAPTGSDRPGLYGDLRSWALAQADSLALLASLPDACVDAVVTDPPYGLAFNGAAWDGGALANGHGFQAFSASWAREIRRVLRPGGYLTCFGATRTFHRLVSGVEDAGMEVRDQLLWLHGRGIPKTGQLPGGRSTSLKPAYEPILLARAPLPAGFTVRKTLEHHGTGALNIAATRLPRGTPGAASDAATGYWPSHLILGHQPDCQASSPGADGTVGACSPQCVTLAIDELGTRSQPLSRLFYAAKADPQEREAGCAQLPRSDRSFFAGTVRPRSNIHPTVKPIDLMRWLVRLTAPPGGVVLDPFAGSGSTGCATVLEGRQFIGIEREPEFVPIARARLAHWTKIANESHGASLM